MKLLGSYPSSIPNPHHSDIDAAIKLFLKTEHDEIRLSKTENDWIRAYWGSAIGVKVEHRDPTSGRVYQDTSLFMGISELRSLFNGYARSSDNWKRIVKWHPVDLKPSFKRLLESIIWVIRILTLVLVAVMLLFGIFLGVLSELIPWQWNSEMYWGIAMLMMSLGGIAWSIVEFIYRVKEDISRDILGIEALFPFSLFSLIAALVIMYS